MSGPSSQVRDTPYNKENCGASGGGRDIAEQGSIPQRTAQRTGRRGVPRSDKSTGRTGCGHSIPALPERSSYF